MNCTKKCLILEEAEDKIASDLLSYLNGVKGMRRQTYKYWCNEHKAWHTTTIRGPYLKKLI